jgi:endonuclease/exonuclease/phosphatase (EEP) superfamily protein YafD
MQFDSRRYPVQDFKFIPTGTMGMMAREFEQAQIISLMSTLGPNSPVLPLLLQSVVEASSLPNRETILQQLAQLSQPDPAAQQAQQQAMQIQIATAQADVQEKQARAQKAQAEAQKAMVEAQLMPEKLKVDVVQAASTNIDDPNREFERRVKIAELMLKEKDIDSKVNIVREQTRQDAMN